MKTKKILMAVFVMASFGAMSQGIKLSENYKRIDALDSRIYTKSIATYKSKSDAIHKHLYELHAIGIDTMNTLKHINYDNDVPIFTSFMSRYSDETAIVTYIRKNELGKFESVFMECQNISFVVFSDADRDFIYEP